MYIRIVKLERRVNMNEDIQTQNIYFSKPGSQNTDKCLDIASVRARELGIKKIVIASCSGQTALQALNYFDVQKYQLITLTHVTGFQKPNEQEMPEEMRDELRQKGFYIYTGAHAFGSVGRGVRNKLNTYQVDEIMAYTLRMFSQGVKVGVEVALMCADAGLVRTDEQILTIAGTMSGADTAMVIIPANSHTCLELKVNEIIAKPWLNSS